MTRPFRKPTTQTDSVVRPRWSLSSALLVITLVAVGLANWRTSLAIQRMHRQLPGLRSVARELQVEDPDRIVAISKTPERFDQNVCEIYLPSHTNFQLNLALDDVPSSGTELAQHQQPISSGIHKVEIRYETNSTESITSVLVDDAFVWQIPRPKDWEPRRGSTGGLTIGTNETFSVDQSVVLFRRTFAPTANKNPGDPQPGILVWISKREAIQKK